eukprot:CAMPEP_0168768404 /NCGR_PEP_ID=MMETSP0725-20121227/1866_1 /TAXON_ID=265536 /ORGANISM="Amphiprora sp., Strain CCMP467" /LENGTH=235 /DNA_ID=CAMNT_0008817775 /DNA_START=132 /DNA_END=836 /DNA_ORIENTATION=-
MANALADQLLRSDSEDDEFMELVVDVDVENVKSSDFSSSTSPLSRTPFPWSTAAPFKRLKSSNISASSTGGVFSPSSDSSAVKTVLEANSSSASHWKFPLSGVSAPLGGKWLLNRRGAPLEKELLCVGSLRLNLRSLTPFDFALSQTTVTLDTLIKVYRSWGSMFGQSDRQRLSFRVVLRLNLRSLTPFDFALSQTTVTLDTLIKVYRSWGSMFGQSDRQRLSFRVVLRLNLRSL